jgi:hypothetical protein
VREANVMTGSTADDRWALLRQVDLEVIDGMRLGFDAGIRR